MSVRTEEWVSIVQPDGQKMVASPSYVKNLLGLDVELFNIKNTLMELKARVHVLEAPQRQTEVLEELKKQPRSYDHLKGIIPKLDYSDIKALEQREIITLYKAGNNKTMLSIVTHEERSKP